MYKLYNVYTSSATMAGQKDMRCVEENLRRRVLKLRKTAEEIIGCLGGLKHSESFSREGRRKGER